MSRRGKPLRFLGAVVGGWVLMRVGVATASLLWQFSTPATVAGISKEAVKTPMVKANGPRIAGIAIPPVPIQPFRQQEHPTKHPFATALALAAPGRAAFAATASLSPPRGAAAMPPSAPTPEARPQAAPQPAAPVLAGAPSIGTGSRWTLTGWLLWRGDGGATLAQAPLLGGSQGGIRLDYRLWSRGERSLGIYGRVTRALDAPHAEEGAIGISLRPIAGMPVALLAERRQKLGNGGRSGFAFLAAGGIGPTPVRPRLELEGYAQAGIVGLPGSDGFADGRLSLDYRLTGKAQPDVALGLALSGAAQTGASRLDLGPELRVRLPVAGGHMRLSAEWRERIAGSALPGSGPAVALVTEF